VKVKADMSQERVKLQILLRKDKRTPDGVAAIRKALISFGIRPSASGLVTVSATVDADQFERVFGSAPRATKFHSNTLPVPEPLAELAESISVAPQHLYMGPQGHLA
jgi:hypothetical protein